MIEEDITVQESLEFLRIGTLTLLPECRRERGLLVWRRQPVVEEISDFDRLGISPILTVSVARSGFWCIIHRHKAQNLGQ